MAVYTEINKEELTDLLQQFDLGKLEDFKGIEGGIENTNYFVNLTDRSSTSEYVLTLFEELSEDELPYFIELCQWLHDRNIPVPYAIQDKNGIAQKRIKNRPAAFQPKLAGSHVTQSELTPAHCTSVGKALAEFHLAAEDFYLERQAHRGVFWWRRESELIAPKLNTEEKQILKEAVQEFDVLCKSPGNIKTGTVHGDLFHDNVLFAGTDVSAILDLYNAATAFQLFDLAIVANDWCFNSDGTIDTEREQALLSSYASVRPFTSDEYRAWPILARTAAMRFWLSRLIPWHDENSEQKLKDPDDMKRVLLHRRSNPSQLP